MKKVKASEVKVVGRGDKTMSRLERLIGIKIMQEDLYAIAAILYLYELQTEVEKREGTTSVRNGVGLSKSDAPAFTTWARRIMEKGNISQGQLDVARRRALKYRKQLVYRFVSKRTAPEINEMFGELKI
jgi:hypothetical protein